MSESAEDKARREHVRRMLEDAREQCAPVVQQMLAAATQTYIAAAKIAGDPVNPANENFWRITGNLFPASNSELDPRGPEIAALVQLAKAVAASSDFEAWASAHAICDRLFDVIDGGEELGLSDAFLGVKWSDDTQRAAALKKGMQFHRVPSSYQSAVSRVVEQIMLATPDAWHCNGTQLPQPWAMCCTYVIAAIAERVKGAQMEAVH